MSEYQITYWRDLPSLVVARDDSADGSVTKTPLAPRFQEAIDEAAMRLGETDSEAYLAGWRRSDWTPSDATPTQTTETVVAELEAQWSPEAVTEFLDAIGPGSEDAS